MKEFDLHKLFEKVVDLAGGQSAAGDICGCSASNINQLLKRESPCPAHHAVKFARVLDVELSSIRPDLWPEGI